MMLKHFSEAFEASAPIVKQYRTISTSIRTTPGFNYSICSFHIQTGYTYSEKATVKSVTEDVLDNQTITIRSDYTAKAGIVINEVVHYHLGCTFYSQRITYKQETSRSRWIYGVQLRASNDVIVYTFANDKWHRSMAKSDLYKKYYNLDRPVLSLDNPILIQAMPPRIDTTNHGTLRTATVIGSELLLINVLLDGDRSGVEIPHDPVSTLR